MTNNADIVLTTANARYSHCAFGLKRLWVSLGADRHRARIMEFTIQQDAREIAMTLLEMRPRIIGFGVYIWNTELLSQVVGIIREAAPEIVLVLGGAEMVDGDETMPVIAAADYVIMGEGEEAFASLAARLLRGERPQTKMIAATPPALDALPDPYSAYTDEDIRQRMIYVESSRGCPYQCAFCLSGQDGRMRYFPLDRFLAGISELLARGARRFKFTDRTFNVNEARVLAILDFFLRHQCQDVQMHFEIMPDRLSNAVLERMAAFPPNALHLELGIQSVSPETQRKIRRNQHIAKSMETVFDLRNHTGAVLHADLIVGLPGDTESIIGEGFNMLVEARIQEIQVGLLKRLKGTALAGELGARLIFDKRPPYEILETPTLSHAAIQRLKRFARYFDLYYNSGNFPETLPLLWKTADTPFTAFSMLAAYVWNREQKTHQLPLVRLAEHIYHFLLERAVEEPARIARIVESDFRRLKGRRDKLPFLGH